MAQVVGLGCREEAPPATLEGTLRLDGKPLDNCLVTFFPEFRHEANLAYSAGLTDRQGVFHLRTSNQQEGVALGRHRVTIQDLSVSTGVSRRDHGTIDRETETVAPPPPIRRSRIASEFMFPESTPLRQDVRPGRQVVTLDVEGPAVGGRKGG